jgi:hypothetical protein
MSKNMDLSFAAATHLAEGLYLSAQLTLTYQILRIKFGHLSCRHTDVIVSMMEWQFILPLKKLLTNKVSGVRDDDGGGDDDDDDDDDHDDDDDDTKAG